jgi:hypothetical protein
MPPRAPSLPFATANPTTATTCHLSKEATTIAAANAAAANGAARCRCCAIFVCIIVAIIAVAVIFVAIVVLVAIVVSVVVVVMVIIVKIAATVLLHWLSLSSASAAAHLLIVVLWLCSTSTTAHLLIVVLLLLSVTNVLVAMPLSLFHPPHLINHCHPPPHPTVIAHPLLWISWLLFAIAGGGVVMLSPILPQMLGRTFSCWGAALTNMQVGWFFIQFFFQSYLEIKENTISRASIFGRIGIGLDKGQESYPAILPQSYPSTFFFEIMYGPYHWKAEDLSLSMCYYRATQCKRTANMSKFLLGTVNRPAGAARAVCIVPAWRVF